MQRGPKEGIRGRGPKESERELKLRRGECREIPLCSPATNLASQLRPAAPSLPDPPLLRAGRGEYYPGQPIGAEPDRRGPIVGVHANAR